MVFEQPVIERRREEEGLVLVVSDERFFALRPARSPGQAVPLLPPRTAHRQRGHGPHLKFLPMHQRNAKPVPSMAGSDPRS